MARTEESGWSSIYVFSTTGELGITRTATLRRDNGLGVMTDYGVMGIDFEMQLLSQILSDTVFAAKIRHANQKM
jgi:hypothetical protein